LNSFAPASAALYPLTESDFATLPQLARLIWFAHYAGVVSKEQIEYMLAGCFTAENLRRYVKSEERWFEILKVNSDAVGYCSYALAGTDDELKLEQLYLLPVWQGCGLGALMLRHIESRARALHCRTLMLQVNKRNARSVAFYRKSGFTVREAASFDIGNGYVIDDYVMEKQLQPPA
jgi:diamine N-acetyltransferase